MTESFVSLSTVSLRLIKQPEPRSEFQKRLEKELREILDIPKTVAVTTMPDTPLWWQRAKKLAEQIESERKFAEEHPECAKSPTGKHEWRFGTCVWCGKQATEITTSESREKLPSDLKEISIYFDGELVTWDWKTILKPVQVKAKDFWIIHGARRGDVGQLIAIKRTGYALEESLRISGIPTVQDVWIKVKYPDGTITEGRFEEFEVISGQKLTLGTTSQNQKLWRLWFTTPMGFEAFSWIEAKTKEEAEKEARKWVPEGSELRFVDSYDEEAIKELLRGFSRSELEVIAKGSPCALEAYVHAFRTEKVPIIVQRVAEKIMVKGSNV